MALISMIYPDLTHLTRQKLEDITASMRMVAEGVKTAASVDALSSKMGVEMPICRQVFEVSSYLSSLVLRRSQIAGRRPF